jgi:Ala-tRNA(Pro) deacylase
MAISGRLKHFLDAARIPYEVRPHDRKFGAQAVAHASHISGHQMAKVVVVQDIAQRSYMVVLPADEQLDFEALEWTSGAKGMRLASEGELALIFPDCEVGAMPPFGHLYGVPVYLDDAFLPKRRIYFEDGTHGEVVGMRCRDFLRLERPVLAHVTRGVARHH